jgi:putative FmdB family regulatory protein
MPNYDYECTHCKHKEEILQKITEEALTICPQCHKSTFKRKFGKGIGLQFQGSGFYATDYGTSSSDPTSAPVPEKPTSSSGPECGCGKSSCAA